jgi:hypothetical protein
MAGIMIEKEGEFTRKGSGERKDAGTSAGKKGDVLGSLLLFY